MDLQDYVNILHKTEQAEDVNRWKLEGFRVWPLFRARVIPMFKDKGSFYSEPAVHAQGRIGLKQRLIAIYQSFRFRSAFRRKADRLFAGVSCDVLLYSKNHSHTDKVAGRWYDRFVDPFDDVLKPDYTIRKLVLVNAQDKPLDGYSKEVLLLDHADLQTSFHYRRQWKKMTRLSETEAYRSICSLTGIDFPARHLDSALKNVTYYFQLFDEVFSRIKPRIVFLKCHYEDDSSGLILAAKRHGIKTVDVQHGKQGVAHPMYSHWTKIPEGGYELLPDYFWNWGEESKYNIERWMNNKNIHRPVVGGNLWLAKWKSGAIRFTGTDAENAFIASLDRYEKVILFTLQPIEKGEMMPAFIAEAIRQSPPGWIWLLRKHPFQSIAANDLLAMTGPAQATVEAQHSGVIPLYELLRHTHVHITLWSSTAFEANDFGVPTILAHPFGLSLYEMQVKDKIFSGALTTDELLDRIRHPESMKAAPYIESDPEVIKRGLAEIGLPVTGSL